MKKKLLFFLLLLAIVSGGLLLINNKISQDITNIISSMDYGYEYYCTDEFLDIINEKPNNIISSISKKNKIINMLENGTCYKHNGVTSTFYFFTENNDGLELKKEDGYVGVQAVFIDCDGQMINDYEAKIKIRGNSTSIAPKKPYNIKFSEKQDLIGAGAAKKYNLLSECYDKTLMRNKLCLDLGLRLGLEETSNSQYVEVYMDNFYLGVYLLTEAVEVGETRVNIDVDQEDFLLELEAEREEDDVTYITSDHGIRFALSEPEEPSLEQKEKIESVVTKFDEYLFSGDYELLKNIIDVDSFIKTYLIHEFTKPVDVWYSSFYMYYKNGKLYAGPIWDFDLSTGNADKTFYSSYWEVNNPTVSYDDYYCRNNNPIYKQLFSYDEIKDFYQKYLNGVKNELYEIAKEGGCIDELLDKYGLVFSKNNTSTDKGGAGWMVYDKYSYVEVDPKKTYEANVEDLKNWINNRIDWLLNN